MEPQWLAVQWLEVNESTIGIHQDQTVEVELTLALPTAIGPERRSSPRWPAGTRITVHPPRMEEPDQMDFLGFRAERLKRVIQKLRELREYWTAEELQEEIDEQKKREQEKS